MATIAIVAACYCYVGAVIATFSAMPDRRPYLGEILNWLFIALLYPLVSVLLLTDPDDVIRFRVHHAVALLIATIALIGVLVLLAP